MACEFAGQPGAGEAIMPEIDHRLHRKIMKINEMKTREAP